MKSDLKLITWATRPGSVGRNQAFMVYLAGNDVKNNLTIPYKKIIVKFCAEEKSLKKYYQLEIDKVFKNWQKHLDDYISKSNQLVEKAKNISRSVGKIADNKLFKLYEEYFQEARTYGIYLFLPFALSEYWEVEIQQKYPKHFEIITSLGKSYAFHKMQTELLEKTSLEISQKYGWMSTYSLYEKPYTTSFFTKLKKKINKKELKKNIQQIEKNNQSFQKFIKSIKNPQDKIKCIIMHEYAFIRTDRIDNWKKALFYLLSLYRYLAKNHPEGQCTQAEIVNITKKEMKKILLKNKYPSKNELKKRLRKNCIVEYFQDDVYFIYNEKKINKIKSCLEKFNKNIHEFKGFVANDGKIVGKVVIVKSKEDLPKVKDGDILVTVVTDPIYTQYMKKCSAVITDEGGITCHAAIVSRELGIPCIIGTKIATKVLKDGDLVEVDADKGIVRKLMQKQT